MGGTGREEGEGRLVRYAFSLLDVSLPLMRRAGGIARQCFLGHFGVGILCRRDPCLAHSAAMQGEDGAKTATQTHKVYAGWNLCEEV
jgi:hypothetical protein